MLIVGINKLGMRLAEPNAVRLVLSFVPGKSGIIARAARSGSSYVTRDADIYESIMAGRCAEGWDSARRI
jgi:hypothetical protein